jgi:Calcineurin-like phosphoesterase/Hemopexin
LRVAQETASLMFGAFDTAVFVPGRGLYVFAGDRVWRYGDGGLSSDPGFPRPITAEFPGVFTRDLDAALVHPDGSLHLFRDDQHIRYDIGRGRPEAGYPRPHTRDWPGIFSRGINAALTWDPDTVYLFSGDHYTSFSPRRGEVRRGFPKAIRGNWPELDGGPVHAALSLPGDRRVLITAGGAHWYDRHGNPQEAELELPMLHATESVPPPANGHTPGVELRFRDAEAEVETFAEDLPFREAELETFAEELPFREAELETFAEPVTERTPEPVEESFELIVAPDNTAFTSHEGEHEQQASGGTGGSDPAVRILWPALGFPAVIAPSTTPTRDPATRSVARTASVLVLCNRQTLSAEDAARHLRIVPWKERTRRYIADGQPGCFTAADLEVKSDVPATPLTRPHRDDRGEAVWFGGQSYENSIVASLSRKVRSFYEAQGLRYLHEIRISEEACAKLPDDLYHLFWNGSPGTDGSASAELELLLDKYAQPTREASLAPVKSPQRLRIDTLVEEYRREYGPLHQPYQQADRDKRFTEVLHPLFVRRSWTGRAQRTVSIGHVTDTHVNVRDDVYAENLKFEDPAITWDGINYRYKKDRIIRYNNYNQSFDRVYSEAKAGSDVILMTGDLIDYGRGPLGLVDGGAFRRRLGEDWTYHADRNWFLFYYLLASRSNYSVPVYTSLGNHDWRLNPYPPFAKGAPKPSSLVHNHLDFSDDELVQILEAAHGPGHGHGSTLVTTRQAYQDDASHILQGLLGALTGNLAFAGSPLQTTVDSVLWYLLLINPFLDYAAPLPGGQQVLMLDWGEREEIYNFASAKSWTEYSQRAANVLSPLQEWHVTEFTQSSGAAKVIGTHAPPLGPDDNWSEEDLAKGERTFNFGEDSRMRRPTDDKTIQVTQHTLCAVAPKDAPLGVAAVFGTFVPRREWFVRKVAESTSGIRLVLGGHIHREGLLVAYPPTNDKEARLLKSVTYAEASDQGRGVGHGIAAIRHAKVTQAGHEVESVKAFPSPLYVNTPSAGPRPSQYDENRNLPDHDGQPQKHDFVAPGWINIELTGDGMIRTVASRQLAEPSRTLPAPGKAAPPTHHEAVFTEV